VAGVDQEADQRQAGPAAQIGEDQLGPGLDRGLGRPGIAVAGHVDQDEPTREVEEVELLGPARRVGGSGEPAPAHERVQQRALADVRATGERHLGRARGRQLLEPGHAQEEAGRAGEQQPARLERGGLGLDLGRADGHRGTSRHAQPGLTPMRFMISHCWPIDKRLFQVQ
jgi:hypothetical protein